MSLVTKLSLSLSLLLLAASVAPACTDHESTEFREDQPPPVGYEIAVDKQEQLALVDGKWTRVYVTAYTPAEAEQLGGDLEVHFGDDFLGFEVTDGPYSQTFEVTYAAPRRDGEIDEVLNAWWSWAVNG